MTDKREATYTIDQFFDALASLGIRLEQDEPESEASKTSVDDMTNEEVSEYIQGVLDQTTLEDVVHYLELTPGDYRVIQEAYEYGGLVIEELFAEFIRDGLNDMKQEAIEIETEFQASRARKKYE